MDKGGGDSEKMRKHVKAKQNLKYFKEERL